MHPEYMTRVKIQQLHEEANRYRQLHPNHSPRRRLRWASRQLRGRGHLRIWRRRPSPEIQGTQ